MKFLSGCALFAFSSLVTGSPLARRQEDGANSTQVEPSPSMEAEAPAMTAPPAEGGDSGISDIDVLQFALTLEHLENVFYKQALSHFSEGDFYAAGFSAQYFNNLKFIVHDEEAHVVFLDKAISDAGATPVKACHYEFPFADVRSFVGLGSILEGVGVSAYLGGAPVISDKDILTAAGAILVAEGLHQSVQRDSLGLVASANIVGTPVGPNAIFTLASAFIVECPPENPPLPFEAFPVLTLTRANPVAPNVSITFSTEAEIPESFFITFVSGLEIVSVAASVEGDVVSATVPDVVEGQSYAFMTSSEASGSLMDSQVLAGPAILEVTPDAPTFDFNLL